MSEAFSTTAAQHAVHTRARPCTAADKQWRSYFSGMESSVKRNQPVRLFAVASMSDGFGLGWEPQTADDSISSSKATSFHPFF